MDSEYATLVRRAALAATSLALALLLVKIFAWWYTGSVSVLAALVVVVELCAISAIRTRYMETPFWRAALQVVLGGVLVLLAGVAIGSA